MIGYLNRVNRNKYIKKGKTPAGVDLTVVDSFIIRSPLSSIDFPSTSTIIDSFADAVDAIDMRRDLFCEYKGREKQIDGEWERAIYCLAILSNTKVPTKKIVLDLCNEYLDEEDTDYDDYLTMFINRVNTYRYYLRNLLGDGVFNTTTNADALILSYMRACAYIINSIVTSFDPTTITFYQDVVSYWDNKKTLIDGKTFSWDEIYNTYAYSERKPNAVRFISQFCKERGYSRNNAQIYLLIYGDKACFTKDDLKVISSDPTRFLDILRMIKELTRK